MSTYSMTSDDLIASIKRRAAIPVNQSTFQNKDFLAFADEEMAIGLIPTILRMHEDYLLYTELVPIEANVSHYPIPYRAIGNKIREVSYQDGNGTIYEMTRIGVGDLPFYNAKGSGRPFAFYIENNNIVLAPSNRNYNANSFLRISYYMRPNSLVMLDDVGVITSINRNTGVIQVANLPKTFASGKKYDLIQVTSPNKTLGFDLIASDVNLISKTITLDANKIPHNLAPGDHISIALTTAIPQVPSDLHVILAHRVALRCLEAMGDMEGLAVGNQKLAEMDKQSETLIDSRVEDAPRKVVARHTSLGRLGRRFRRRGY